MKINCKTDKGGAITLNEMHGVGCSYAVSGRSDDELLYAWLSLSKDRHVQFFVNRKTGLVTVDVIGAKGGNEVLRIDANEVKLPR